MGIGPLIYKTKITDTKTKKSVEGYGWTRKEANKSAHEKDRSSSGGSSSSGGCYITTACVDAIGLPDNAFELRVLRGFRDKVLMPDPRGRRAVMEYYRIAPDIVQAVEEQDDPQNIWKSVYRDVRHAVSLVLSGDFEGAFKHYQNMTLRLKNNYLG